MATIYYTDSNLTLANPRGITVDYDRDSLLICEYGSDQVVLCTLQGLKEIDTLGYYDSNAIAPINACYYDGYFYVCDYDNHTLVRIRARDLSYKDYFGTYGTSGSTSSTLNQPAAVTTDGQYLYIIDSGNKRIMKLVRETLTYYDETSSINGALTQPKGIIYKREGGEALFISDKTRIVKCKTDFTYIEQVATGLTNPNNMAFKNDYLHVCDGAYIKVFSSNGLTLTETFSDDTLASASGIDIHEDSMFIADVTNDRISVWRRYNPFDDLTSSSSIKFGSEFFQNPYIRVGEDTLIAGTTQDYSLNHWKEENNNNFRFGFIEEDNVSSTWTEEHTGGFPYTFTFTFGAGALGAVWTEEDDVSSSWAEESDVSSTWTEES